MSGEMPFIALADVLWCLDVLKATGKYRGVRTVGWMTPVECPAGQWETDGKPIEYVECSFVVF